MDSDQMKIDPTVLEHIMVLIERYATNQKDVLTKLTSSMRKLSDEWDDDKTFGEMLKHIETIDKRSAEMFEQMRKSMSAIAQYNGCYYNEGTNKKGRYIEIVLG